MKKEFVTFLANALESSASDVPEPIIPVKEKVLSCAFCSSKHANTQELSAHMFSKHGVKSNLPSKIVSNVCEYCLSDFHTRTKLHNHVAYRSVSCKSYYELAVPPGDEILFLL